MTKEIEPSVDGSAPWWKGGPRFIRGEQNQKLGNIWKGKKGTHFLPVPQHQRGKKFLFFGEQISFSYIK